jgi:hypothetical protein
MTSVTILYEDEPVERIKLDVTMSDEFPDATDQLTYDDNTHHWIVKTGDGAKKYIPRSSIHKITGSVLESEYEGGLEPIENQTLKYDFAGEEIVVIGNKRRPLIEPLQYRADIDHWYCRFEGVERIDSQKTIRSILVPRERVLWAEIDETDEVL